MEDFGKIIEEQAQQIEEENKRKQTEADNTIDKRKREVEESVKGISENGEFCGGEETEKQTVDYGVNNGVAEYAGIKKPLPQKMQKILFAILAVMQTALIVLFCVPFSAVNIIADGLEGVVKKFETLSRPTRIIMLCALGVICALVLVLVIVRIFSSRASC